METRIRRASIKDAPQLIECIDAAYARYRDIIKDLPDVSAGVAEDLETNIVFIAERGEKLAGGLVLSLTDETALLANLAVHPDFGGLGIARQLIDRAIQECQQNGCAKLLLSTHVDMPENIAFYQHLGWTIVSGTGNKIRMEKSL